MGFMKRFRSKQKLKDKEHPQLRSYAYEFPAVYTGPDCTARLDDKILRRILEYVCPHAIDDSYDASELFGTEGCMTCDTRDLAHCALTKRQWYGVAAGLLYKSIRIDAVHYCELEEVYAEQRRRKSRGHDPIDPPTERLRQLCRTVRDNSYIAQRVHFLKLPYMTREGCKADLARTVSVLPNLEYVDLPDGFFTGEAASHTLRQELQARCPRIRKMRYNEGSEQLLESLLQGYWRELRVVEISKIQFEPTVLRRIFGLLPWLSDVSFEHLPWLGDSIFHSAAGIPDFPALDTLTLKKIRNVTQQGLAQYLSTPLCRDTLKTINIKDCAGIPVSALHSILWAGTGLEHMTYIATVSAALPIDPLPPLASISLRVLNFEITSSASNQHSMYPPAASYYQYLTTSLMSSSLPTLRQLYVLDPDFAESLTLAPPIRPFADSPHHTPRGFNQPLEVFSKGLDELDWVFTSVMPADAYGRRGSMSGGRPLSSYSASKGLGPQWGGESRKSIVVPNGFGGFLAIPADDERPKSAGNISTSYHNGTGNRGSWFTHTGREKRGSRADLWR
ncbi:F-box domain-containing protein [Lindgomyces ingoldianus]|uniref:F-box domain-containing protein n=1 Tax=Lindgomyces ingoldianus TaxID=673940 RepID=A0ACB6QP00_9PLEO|nr:F-box domain-containing protein [Lindgomyces ingoldianus]KAF2467840.1 F-box domain-containing protein [Lindgomyces ingoldianus]